MESSEILERIDHTMLAKLSDASLLEEVKLVGNKQGWQVVVRYKNIERYLFASVNKQIRIFRRLDTAIFYLKTLGIDKVVVHTVDENLNIPKRSRPDRSTALKKTHSIAKRISQKE